MKDFYIRDFRPGDEIVEFFMLKSLAIKTGSNGKDYLDVLLGDATGEISGKKWDIVPEEYDALTAIEDGSLVRIKGTVTEWNGIHQIRIMRIRKAVKEDKLDPADYVKAAPEDPRKMYDYIMERAEGITDSDLRALSVRILRDNEEKLMYYPAAQKNHHAELGGLLWHMKRMLMTGERICDVYTNLNKDFVITGVIIHDIEKINEIESNEFGVSPGYSFEGQLLGHIVQGVKTIDRLTLEMNFPREKAIMLEHMVLSHHYEPDFGSPKKPLFPEAEILHYLDMIDAKMFDMEDALAATEPGGFSERVFTLDGRKVYKPSSNR